MRACDPRRVQGCSAQRPLQVPLGESHHIAHRLIHGKNASREAPVRDALPVFELHFKRSQLIAALRHTRSRDCIRDQNNALWAFRLQQEIYHDWIDVHAVRDNIRGDMRVRQYLAQNSRLAVVERAHRIESVSRMPGPGSHPFPR